MPRDNRPNVVVFFTDQQRWDTSGLHGCPLDLMPNFDRMAQEGTHAAHAFTPMPVCGPARASLQTGLYPTAVGCPRNGIPLPAGAKTLAHFFRQGGYTTGYIGKWHLAAEDPVPEAARGGYEYWLAANILEYTSDAYDCVVFDARNRPVKLPGYRVDGLTDAAIRYIDAHQREPFFLFLSFIEPHFQNHLDDYPPPDGYRERYAGRWMPPDLAALGGSAHQHWGGYCGMVKRLDEALGRLLDALKSLRLLDDTVVVFTSDHGCHFKTRNSEYKRSCHESSVRVPMALRGGCFTGGGRIREMVSLVDLPPTLLEAAGLPVPPHFQGRSIIPLIQGRRNGWPEEVFVQVGDEKPGRMVRTRRWKYSVTALDRPDAYREECLYDMEFDPHEMRNLIGRASHRPVAAVMRERLLRRMAEAGENEPEIEESSVGPADRFRVTEEEARS